MKVEYLLSCPHGIYQFEPVCKELLLLGVEACFVIPDFIPTGETCRNILSEKNLPFKTKIDPNADISVTISGHTFLYNYKNLKIKFKYGVNISRDASNTSGSGACCFDGILVHGRYEKDLIEKLQVIPSERIRIMGYPKHDRFFREKEPVEQIKKKLQIDVHHNKKIITYFPTWGVKSSIDLFYKSLLGLKKEYYIVIKPHHNNFYLPEKLTRWKKFELISDLLLGVHTPFANAAAVADIVIADGRSGSLSEAALINPTAPLIGLHVTDESPKNCYYQGVFGACTFVSNPEDIQNVVRNVAESDQHCEKRRLFAQDIFSYVGQNCAKIAANQIIDLSVVKKISPKPKPLWLRNCKRRVKDAIEFFIK